jgi:hypothetical protein
LEKNTLLRGGVVLLIIIVIMVVVVWLIVCLLAFIEYILKDRFPAKLFIIITTTLRSGVLLLQFYR